MLSVQVPTTEYASPAPLSYPPQVFFILIDGLGDATCSALGNRTPLQHAYTPALDALAANGVTGLYDPYESGIACGSDTAHLSIFGYPPRTFPLARGPLECLGAGMEVEVGALCFKSVFSTLADDGLTVKCRRADSNFTEEGERLCNDLNNHLTVPKFPEITVKFKYATEHRCGVTITSTKPLSPNICGTDPLSDGLPLIRSAPRPTAASDPVALYTSSVVNAVSDAIRVYLSTHAVNAERLAAGRPPANVVLLRAPGMYTSCPSVHDRHGLHVSLVAGTAVIRGLASCIGANVIHNVPGANGDYTSDFGVKAAAAADILLSIDGLGGEEGVGRVREQKLALENGEIDQGKVMGPIAERCDMMFLHLKAVDEASHDKDPHRKAALLEAMDQALAPQIARLQDYYGQNGILFVLTGDHSTPCHHGDHGPAPVPFLMSGAGIAPDSVVRFDEISCARGALGRFRGDDIMPAIKALTNCPGPLSSALRGAWVRPVVEISRSATPLAAGTSRAESKGKVRPKSSAAHTGVTRLHDL